MIWLKIDSQEIIQPINPPHLIFVTMVWQIFVYEKYQPAPVPRLVAQYYPIYLPENSKSDHY